MKANRTVFALFALAGLTSGVASADATILPASAYAQKGLVAHWDGIENAGKGQTPAASPSSIVDLVGGYEITLGSGESATVSRFYLNKVHAVAGLFAAKDVANPVNVTMEVRCKPTALNGAYHMPVLQTANRNGFGFDKRTSGGITVIHKPTTATTSADRDYYHATHPLNDPAKIYAADAKAYSYAMLCDTSRPRVYVDGSAISVDSSRFYWGNATTYSDEMSVGNASAPAHYESIRIYSRQLSAVEIAINANIDRMRYEGADPSSLTWPEGWRVRADGVWEIKFSFVAAAGGSVSTTETWVTPGSTVTVTATPETGKCVAWTGDTAAIQSEGHNAFANCITVKADAPITLTATFPDLAADKPTDFTADGVTGTFADRVLTIDVATGKTCTYNYADKVTTGWVTNIVKTGAGSLTPAVASAYLGSFDFQAGTVTLNAAGQLGANNVGVVCKASGATINSSRTVTTGKKMYLAGTVNHNSWNTFVSSCDIVLTGDLTMSSSGKAKDVVVATGSQLDMNGYNLTVYTDQMLIAQLNGMTITNSNDSVASVIAVGYNTRISVSGGTSFWGGSRNQLKTSTDYGNQGFTYTGTVGGDWTILSRGANFQVGSGSSANTLANKIDCAVTVSQPSQYGYTTKYNNLTTDSCLTFSGPLAGTSTMDVRGGTLNFLNAANTYSGVLTLTDATSSKIRPCIYVWNGANFSAGSVTLKNADIWMDDNTAFAFPAITLGNGTKAANCCTITGGPTGDKACGRATIAGFTKSGGNTLTVDSPVHITGTTLVSTNTLALGSGTTANELPVFDHLSFAAGTTFDMNGKDLTIGNLTGIPTVTNPGTLTITGNWTVSGDAIVDGGKLNLGAGALAFASGATITIEKGTKEVPTSAVIAVAQGGVTGRPTSGVGGVRRIFSTSQSGTELRANVRGMVLVFR